MDSGTFHNAIIQNPHLVTCFAGVWSADDFPKQLTGSKKRRQENNMCQRPRLICFQIVNTSPAGALGKHWLRFGAVVTKQSRIRVFIWDCLGQPLWHYKFFAQHLRLLYRETGFSSVNLRLQNMSSNMCGLYCLFMIDYIARNPTRVPNIDAKLKQFSAVEIVRFMSCQYKTYFRYIVV